MPAIVIFSCLLDSLEVGDDVLFLYSLGDERDYPLHRVPPQWIIQIYSLSLVFWSGHSAELLRSWWPANWGGFLQPFCCCLHARHLLWPCSDQGAPLLWVSMAGVVREGKDEDHCPFNNCPADAHEPVAFLYKLQPSHCWDAGLYSCIPTFHKLAQAKLLKHHTYLWWKVWDAGTLCCSYPSFQIPEMLLLRTATLWFCGAL